MKRSAMDKNKVLKLINTVSWYHRYEISPGVFTPGYCDADPIGLFRRLGLSQELSGMRILEIGTWDGPYAFELESRGAEVIATDIQDPDSTGFNVAKQILKSKVKYVRTSVYDLTKNLDGKFDMVLFAGVFYHLKNPIVAFEQIYEILKDGGTLLFEGECFSHYAENINSKKVWHPLLLALYAYSNLPITLFYSGSYKNDPSNWYIPNAICLRAWLEATRFKVLAIETTVQGLWRRKGNSLLERVYAVLSHLVFNIHQRIEGTAIKIAASPIEEHRIVEKK